MKREYIDCFDREVTCTYQSEAYFVRDNGAVFRYRKKGARKRPLDEKWRFGRADEKRGYMYMSSIMVHRIIATAFHGPQPSKDHVVDHIDTNRRNNRPENLRWVTRLDNILRNPITRRRIEIAYGSIKNFVANPDQPIARKLDPNFEWMRSVTKKEAEETYRRLLDWAKSDSMPSGGMLGEWVHTSRTKLYVEKSEPDNLMYSKTPAAIQKHWKTPSEFPLCLGGKAEAGVEISETHGVDPDKTNDMPIPFIELNGVDVLKNSSVWKPITNNFNPLTRNEHKMNIPEFETKVQRIAKQNNIELPHTYYRHSVCKCWKCCREIIVFTWPRDDLDHNATPVVKPIPRTIQFRFSKTVGHKYWMNTCPYCRSIQGDFFLYNEPEGPFFAFSVNEDSPGAFKEDMVRIATYAEDIGLI